ncbi:hypothetical protein VVR12_03065 [Rothia sp. LK2588]|uniref:hypothetical protein n=1 Tax=Rothia sp. LK2588 TaxID=3114369 RepID=UPI0034CE5113
MRPCALITGVGRKNSIGYATALQLAAEGWDLTVNYLHSYDDRLGLPRGIDDLEELKRSCQ